MQTIKIQSSNLSIQKRLEIARHPKRPKGKEVIQALMEDYEILHGDSLQSDDPSMICALGRLANHRCLCIAQHKGSNLQEKQRCNYGMNSPEGFYKAKRLMLMAEKYHLPIVTIVDTPGALPYLDAEKKGQSKAIASNLAIMSDLKTPIISLVLSEGASGGALAISIADKIVMMEHAYFSVINPRGCASILWKTAEKEEIAAKQLCMQSENLYSFSMIDDIIEEGEGGYHENITEVNEGIKSVLDSYIKELINKDIDKVIEERRKKYRSF